MESVYQIVKTQILPRISDEMFKIGYLKKEKSSVLFRQDGEMINRAFSCEASSMGKDFAEIKIECHISVKSVSQKLLDIGYLELEKNGFYTTLYSNIGYIKGTGYHTYEITTGEEAAGYIRIADNIVEDITRYGVRFFEKFSDEEAVFNLAFSPSNPSVADFFSVDRQSLTAIILADKLNKSHLIPEIIKYTTEFLKKSKYLERSLERFIKFSEKLGHHIEI